MATLRLVGEGEPPLGEDEGYQWGTETIEGVEQQLGRMGLQQLEDLEARCEERARGAAADRFVVRAYISELVDSGGDGPEGAA